MVTHVMRFSRHQRKRFVKNARASLRKTMFLKTTDVGYWPAKDRSGGIRNTQ